MILAFDGLYRWMKNGRGNAVGNNIGREFFYPGESDPCVINKKCRILSALSRSEMVVRGGSRVWEEDGFWHTMCWWSGGSARRGARLLSYDTFWVEESRCEWRIRVRRNIIARSRGWAGDKSALNKICRRHSSEIKGTVQLERGRKGLYFVSISFYDRSLIFGSNEIVL